VCIFLFWDVKLVEISGMTVKIRNNPPDTAGQTHPAHEFGPKVNAGAVFFLSRARFWPKMNAGI
jgi:hypothetical protein